MHSFSIAATLAFLVLVPAPCAQTPRATPSAGLEPNVGQSHLSHDLIARVAGARIGLSAHELLVDRGARGQTRMRIAGAALGARLAGTQALPGHSNYLIGNDRSRWRRNVPHFARAEARGVLPGIDLVYHADRGALEYDFVVAPGADAGAIRLEFEGSRPRLDAAGRLVFDDGLVHEAPVAWEEDGAGGRHPVRAAFRALGGFAFGFDVTRHDPAARLVIDPRVLVFSTFLGGFGADWITDLERDAAGNLVVSGFAVSSNFPVANGYDSSLGGTRDAFVAKLSADGSTLLWCTFLGGSAGDAADHKNLALDASGRIWLSGETSSLDFPTTPGAYQTTFGGGAEDCFFAILDSTGSQLVYSTYVGGPAQDAGLGLAIHQNAFAYLTGYAGAGFPTTPGAVKTVVSGSADAILVVLAPNGNGAADLVYSSFLGGASGDRGDAVGVDSNGSAHLTGRAPTSYGTTFFPTTPNAFQGPPTLRRNDGVSWEHFYARIAPLGNGPADLGYSVLLERGVSIYLSYSDLVVDGTNRAHFCGGTNGTIPTTVNAYQRSLQGNQDAYYVVVDSYVSGAAGLVYATLLGGSGGEAAIGLRLDGAGRALLTGSSQPGGKKKFPTTSDALQTPSVSSAGLFLTVLDRSLSGSAQLVFSTLLAGPTNGWAEGRAVVEVSPGGGWVVAGTTRSADFPTTPGAFSRVHGGSDDGIILKVQ